jgi:dTDP-4-dehydrorhamnose 3,5-epimerase
MIFKEVNVARAFVLEVEKVEDERGFFARSWCQKEFQLHHLVPHLVQANIAFNKQKGTLRGMHYQTPPYGESKVVRCTRGVIFDVVIDLRPESPTFKQWTGVELTADNHRMLYVPENCAHGYITLEDRTEVTYLVSQFYHPEVEQGVRYDDPAFGVTWPIDVRLISQKDRSWPYVSS